MVLHYSCGHYPSIHPLHLHFPLLLATFLLCVRVCDDDTHSPEYSYSGKKEMHVTGVEMSDCRSHNYLEELSHRTHINMTSVI